jgi:hypothetical protein
MKKISGLLAFSMLLAACGPEGGSDTLSDALVEAAPAGQERVVAFAGCYGASCNGRDPIAMGCNADAATRKSANILNPSGAIIGRVELRYSAVCNAKWSKVYNNISYTTSAWMSDSSPNPMIIGGTMFGSTSANQVYGSMYSGFIKACGQVGGYAPACTGAL